MSPKIWNENYRSIACINFYSANGIIVNTFTGFKVGKYLITEKNVALQDKAIEAHVSFIADDSMGIGHIIKMSYKDFKLCINNSLLENYQFVACIFDDNGFKAIPSLKISTKKTHYIGSEIGILGFQSDNNSLALKAGIISTYTKAKNQKFIQFDAAIVRGNSGAPLIDIESNEILGIVGYRLSAVNQSYSQLMKIINGNLEFLKQYEGKLNLMDIDLIQVLMVSQNQVKHIAHEFYRTASLMYGYALDLTLNDEIREFLLTEKIEAKI